MSTSRARGSAFDFFYSHCTPPDGRGRAAYARILADCERHFFDNDWRIAWQHARGTTFTRCTLFDSNRTVLMHEDYPVEVVDVDRARVVRAEMVASWRGLL